MPQYSLRLAALLITSASASGDGRLVLIVGDPSIGAPYASAAAAADWLALTPERRLKRLHEMTLPHTLAGRRQRLCHDGASIASFFEGPAAALALPGAGKDGTEAAVRVAARSGAGGRIEGALSTAEGREFHRFVIERCSAADLARLKASTGKPQPREDGFTIYDEPSPAPKRRFRLKLDAPPDSDPRLPWLAPENRALDVRKHDDALTLAVLVQRYMYEGMANQSKDPNANFDAHKAAARGIYWCNVPWMNVGNAGHEAYLGLTKGHDLVPGDIPFYAALQTGSSFQVAYHNAHSCKTITRAWGTRQKPKDPPDFSEVRFEDGSFSFKPIFTQSPDPALKGAFTVKANVSGPGSGHRRSVQDNRLIQIDVFLRDSRIIGTRPEVRHWIALVYYYDPAYDYDREVLPRVGRPDPLASLPNLAPSLRKLRPAGIQLGLDAEDTIAFNGAPLNGFGGRLNGPQNIKESSCMSCHARAGTSFAQTPGPEGVVMSNRDWLERIAPAEHFDFGFQMNHSRRNWETRDAALDFRLLQDYLSALQAR